MKSTIKLMVKEVDMARLHLETLRSPSNLVEIIARQLVKFLKNEKNIQEVGRCSGVWE